MNREYDFEEDYHAKDRKESRKERKRIQNSDRSKFKKTDRQKKTPPPINPAWNRGRVVAITGEGIWVDTEEKKILASLKGFLKKERFEAKNLIAVGDFVYFTPEYSIAHIEERYSFLARTDISGKKEQLIAVNVDQAVIAVSVVEPPLKPSLADRYLIASEKGNIAPLIVINKIDLLKNASEEEKSIYSEFVSNYELLGIPILSVSTEEGIGLDALRALLKNRTTVFSGQSGVGKSSLINKTFGLELKTGELAEKTAKGTHTTTTARLLPLPGGGYCVDTPGIRSFGVWKLQKEEVLRHFYDLADRGCRYPDCLHISEPGCSVLKQIEKGEISKLRYESYRALLNEATGGSDNRAKRKEDNELD